VPAEIVSFPPAWRRVFLWARPVFAAAGLACALLARANPWATGVAVAYLVFSLFLPFRKPGAGAFGLLVIFTDAVFFLVLLSTGIGANYWLPHFFFLFVCAEAVFLYRPPEVFVVVLVSVLFCLVIQSQNIRRTVIIAGPLAYAFSTFKRRLESRMDDLECEARETREEAQRAREAEQQRIANDFHDGPLQSFIALQMRLEILRKLMERDFQSGMDDLADLQNLAQQQVKELRAFVRSMRPADTQGANLYASSRRICEDFQKESGIPVSFVGGEGPLKIPEEMGRELIQMLREALHNVLKHAGATRVAVSLEKIAKTLELSVDDNGGGFQFSGIYSLDELELLRLGPASLKRRARALNADMILESRPGKGAGLKLRVPVP